MRGERGAAGFDDLTLLLVAVLAFSLFFGTAAAAFVSREARERGERLQALADRLLAVVATDVRWAARPGVLDPDALLTEGVPAIRPIAEGHPFELVLRDLATREEWRLADGDRAGDRRMASTAVSLIGEPSYPGRFTVAVWSR